jgi:predicted XRE-type DNA-binding protein
MGPTKIEASSGNVFADLGLPNPEQELIKAGLTLEIYGILKARKLTQTQAGKILGIPQPHVSDLMRGRARAFSTERLTEFLAALGHDVEIRVMPTRKAQSPLDGLGAIVALACPVNDSARQSGWSCSIGATLNPCGRTDVREYFGKLGRHERPGDLCESCSTCHVPARPRTVAIVVGPPIVDFASIVGAGFGAGLSIYHDGVVREDIGLMMGGILGCAASVFATGFLTD